MANQEIADIEAEKARADRLERELRDMTARADRLTRACQVLNERLLKIKAIVERSLARPRCSGCVLSAPLK